MCDVDMPEEGWDDDNYPASTPEVTNHQATKLTSDGFHSELLQHSNNPFLHGNMFSDPE